VQKVAVNAGFTCPNRDGTKGRGGCIYCNNKAFNPSYCVPEKSISQQISEGIEFHRKRYRRADTYLVYFQPYSNTYAPVEDLAGLYRQALEPDNVVGLVIGTRPDCIDDDKLDLLYELSRKYYVIIEYGIESCYNKTLENINRCHTFEQSVEALEKTAARGLRTGVHIIFGLPGETRDEMLAQAGIISQLPVNNIKFHQLQILKDTPLAGMYENDPGRFELFTLEEYLDFIVDFTELLSPSVVIERISSEVPPRFLIAPDWGLYRTDQILAMFEKKLEERNTWQGKGTP